ncbi:MAG: TolC family protein [Saprospiraceae bacterium]
MKYILLISALMTIGCNGRGIAQTIGDTLTLEAYLEMAKQQGVAQAQAQRDRSLARIRFSIYKTNFRPQVSLSANLPNYLRSFSETTQPDGSVRFQPVQNNNSALGVDVRQLIPQTGGTIFLQSNLQRFDDFESGFYLYNGLPFRVGISQPIGAYNPWKWEKRLAPLRWEEAQLQYETDQRQIVREATALYFELLQAQTAQAIADSNVLASQRLLLIAQERYELGKISQRDLVQIELEQIANQRAQLAAQQLVRNAWADMLTYTGASMEANIPVLHRPVFSTQPLPSVEQALIKAQQNRPEWTAFTRRLIETQQQQEAARRNNGPNIQLTTAFGRIRSSEELSTIYDDAQPEAFVQLQLRVPVFDGGLRRLRKEEATVQEAFTRTAITAETLALEAQIANTLADLAQLQVNLQLAQQVQELAQQRFRITSESYLAGAVSLTERTLAQREQDQAIRDYIDALSACWQTHAALAWLIGL